MGIIAIWFHVSYYIPLTKLDPNSLNSLSWLTMQSSDWDKRISHLNKYTQSRHYKNQPVDVV
jgi:hypothetical protein